MTGSQRAGRATSDATSPFAALVDIATENPGRSRVAVHCCRLNGLSRNLRLLHIRRN